MVATLLLNSRYEQTYRFRVMTAAICKAVVIAGFPKDQVLARMHPFSLNAECLRVYMGMNRVGTPFDNELQTKISLSSQAIWFSENLSQSWS